MNSAQRPEAVAMCTFYEQGGTMGGSRPGCKTGGLWELGGRGESKRAGQRSAEVRLGQRAKTGAEHPSRHVETLSQFCPGPDCRIYRTVGSPKGLWRSQEPWGLPSSSPVSLSPTRTPGPWRAQPLLGRLTALDMAALDSSLPVCVIELARILEREDRERLISVSSITPSAWFSHR